jgi:hypothetical protein
MGQHVKPGTKHDERSIFFRFHLTSLQQAMLSQAPNTLGLQEPTPGARFYPSAFTSTGCPSISPPTRSPCWAVEAVVDISIPLTRCEIDYLSIGCLISAVYVVSSALLGSPCIAVVYSLCLAVNKMTRRSLYEAVNCQLRCEVLSCRPGIRNRVSDRTDRNISV